jgi:type II secretory pathway component GspD/PulD (secretin)
MKSFYCVSAILLAAAALSAAEVAGTPRDSNIQNTAGYDGTRVEAQLLVNVQDKTRVVHFIRDNNDPRVVTKTYLLKHVDPYEIRDYLRQMVQSKRVGNTSLQQQYPLNAVSGGSGTPGTNVGIGTAAASTAAATVSSPVLTTPPTAQPGYNPTLQLGSNTAVECLKYVDGTSLLIVSAEEYRFKDHENGMGLDSIIQFMDRPQMGANYGTQIFFYLPKFVPAKNLVNLIQNVGMNISDVTELWQGQDLVTSDPDLNWLIFDVSNYSCDNIAALLAKYDVPIPQVRLKISVLEVYDENDDKMGIDFQNWKNNEGADFFSAGGRMRNNWSALYSGGMAKAFGSERTSFYNFNPKWNSRYLDFLASSGRAKVVHSGELLIRNNSPAKLDRTTQIFYIDTSKPYPNALDLPDTGVGPYELLSALIGEIRQKTGAVADTVAHGNYPVGKGNQQITTASSGYGFTMTVTNASINLAETSFQVTLNNTSLIGFQSNGQPRISSPSVVSLQVSLPYGRDSFVIGGLRKQEKVESSTGIPWLADIPILGYLFATKSNSVKHSELVVLAQCEWASPKDAPQVRGMSRKTKKP